MNGEEILLACVIYKNSSALGGSTHLPGLGFTWSVGTFASNN